jgi:redox-sensitive bicupin YhaK (pirin superfamily)
MREEWLKEDDQVAALQLVMNPSAALKKLAPRFKALEPDMDRIFWQSRVTR